MLSQSCLESPSVCLFSSCGNSTATKALIWPLHFESHFRCILYPPNNLRALAKRILSISSLFSSAAFQWSSTASAPATANRFQIISLYYQRCSSPGYKFPALKKRSSRSIIVSVTHVSGYFRHQFIKRQATAEMCQDHFQFSKPADEIIQDIRSHFSLSGIYVPNWLRGMKQEHNILLDAASTSPAIIFSSRKS